MKRSGLSEQKIVVVLFVMVIVTFFFAQADTNKFEKMYLNNTPPVTTSLDASTGTRGVSEAKYILPFIPSSRLR